MKVRPDILRLYRDIHSWTGIVSGLLLFVAFLAGSITMFAPELQRWATPPSGLASPPLGDMEGLVTSVLTRRPEARTGYDLWLDPEPGQAAMTWPVSGEDARGPIYGAGIARSGALSIVRLRPSPVGRFVDLLHQQVGLPLPHEPALMVMGAVALLYALALVSGIVILLPSLVKDLFALRIGKNAKRMWLDIHNLLGLLSLPFHIVMAVTSVTFAFHDQIYDTQAALVRERNAPREVQSSVATARAAPIALAPAQLIDRLHRHAPDFVPTRLSYGIKDGRTMLRAWGHDERHLEWSQHGGFASLDPLTGRIVDDTVMPGHQTGWRAVVTSFFALHFGTYGGEIVRWSYALLGLAGAFLFYTGNLLWIRTRLTREQRNGGRASVATRVLSCLTVSVPLGTCLGLLTSTILSKWILAIADDPLLWHQLTFYAMFFLTTLVVSLRRWRLTAITQLLTVR